MNRSRQRKAAPEPGQRITITISGEAFHVMDAKKHETRLNGQKNNWGDIVSHALLSTYRKRKRSRRKRKAPIAPIDTPALVDAPAA